MRKAGQDLQPHDCRGSKQTSQSTSSGVRILCLNFHFTLPSCWGEYDLTLGQFHSLVNLCTAVQTFSPVLSKFQGADGSSQVCTEMSLLPSGPWPMQSPLCLPFLVLHCKRPGSLSANFWAFVSHTGNRHLPPCHSGDSELNVAVLVLY